MVLERYRDSAGRAFVPLASALARTGLTPNGASVLSLVFAVAGGVAFALASHESPGWLLVAAAMVFANAILDALDGVMARLRGEASRRGDYLDHVIDRYADVAILVGVALSPLADVRLGLLALVGTFLTSYMGTQAQALGLGRDYRGLLGRADRLVLLIGAPLVAFGLIAAGSPRPVLVGVEVGALNVLLAYFAVVGNITALQRFGAGWRELSDAPR